MSKKKKLNLELIFVVAMVFVLSQSDLFWEKVDILKFLAYKKLKILVLWPKYITILYNFDKPGCKIV